VLRASSQGVTVGELVTPQEMHSESDSEQHKP
jgi:hypothetical protein